MMENRKLVKCKACGADVAKNAKACPHCGAKVKKGHPILIGILVVFVLFAVMGTSGDSEEPKKVETKTTALEQEKKPEPKETAVEEKTEFYVGETAELKGVKVTFVEAVESDGSTYNTPTDGNVFVLCELEIANDSDAEINVSSMMSFEAYCDDYACNFSLTAMMEKGNKNQLDGTVAPGKKFNGIIGYEVPEDWQELEIKFTPNFLSGKDITFVATNAG